MGLLQYTAALREAVGSGASSVHFRRLLIFDIWGCVDEFITTIVVEYSYNIMLAIRRRIQEGSVAGGRAVVGGAGWGRWVGGWGGGGSGVGACHGWKAMDIACIKARRIAGGVSSTLYPPCNLPR